MLLHYLFAGADPVSILIEFIDETISDREYTYEVLVNHVKYIYRFTLTSNTKCEGSFFIETADWRSPVYTVTRPLSFMHINSTALDYHDVCSFNTQCFLDIYICDGRKKFLTTMSVTSSGHKFIVKYISLPIAKIQDTHTVKAIRDLFAMAGTINTMKQTILDPVSYDSKNMLLVSYSDPSLQVVGIESSGTWRKTSSLQCVNSFFNQRFDFKDLSNDSWVVREYVDDTILKRNYEVTVTSDTIIVPDRKLKFHYVFDNGNIIFRRI